METVRQTEPGPTHRASATQVTEQELLWPRVKVSRRTVAKKVSLDSSHHSKSKLTGSSRTTRTLAVARTHKKRDSRPRLSGFQVDVPLGVDCFCTSVSLPSRPTSWRQALAAESAQGSQLLRGRNLLTAGLHGAPKQPRIRRRRQKEGGCTRSGEVGAGITSMCGPRSANLSRCREVVEINLITIKFFYT